MGNSLIVGKNDQRDNVILNGDGDRYLLNKSINDFFKNRGSKISDATVDNDSGYDTNKKAMLKEILKETHVGKSMLFIRKYNTNSITICLSL